jgi:hypothetical protein
VGSHISGLLRRERLRQEILNSGEIAAKSEQTAVVETNGGASATPSS